jgi:hypothetical protein
MIKIAAYATCASRLFRRLPIPKIAAATVFNLQLYAE